MAPLSWKLARPAAACYSCLSYRAEKNTIQDKLRRGESRSAASCVFNPSTNKTKQMGDANVFMSQIQISNRLILLINPYAIDYFKRKVLFFADYVIFVKSVICLGGQEFILCSRAQPIWQNFVYNFMVTVGCRNQSKSS